MKRESSRELKTAAEAGLGKNSRKIPKFRNFGTIHFLAVCTIKKSRIAEFGIFYRGNLFLAGRFLISAKNIRRIFLTRAK